MGSISRPRTLVTGANGFVGATVVAEALKAGHHVTGSVRSKKSGDELVAIHPEWDSSMIDFVEVADYTADGVFDEIFQQGNYDYVIHVAAPMPDNPEYTDFVTHFEKPSIEGNRQILMSAMRYGNKVKAVSVVVSINAITNGDPTDLKSRVMTDKEWLQLTRDDAIKIQHPFINYCVGKKVAEQQIWKFIEEEKPHFSVTNFMPCLIMGPPLQKIKNLKYVNFSNNFIHQIFNGTVDQVGHTMFPAYVDVRDLADLLIGALTNPKLGNQRCIVGHSFTFMDIKVSLVKMPELEGKLANDNDEEVTPIRLEIKPVEDASGIKWRSADTTFQDTARYILELESRM